MEKETQQNSQRTDRGRWPLSGRQVLTTVAIVTCLVSLSLVGYFFGWWSAAGQHLWVIGLAVAFFIAVVTLTSIDYRKKWTGFGDKTLWSWLQLLIVPSVLGLIGLWFAWAQNAQQEQNEGIRAETQLKAEDQRAQAQLDVEEQRAQDEALQLYFEEIGSLLVDKKLLPGEADKEASALARARTLTVLSRIDANRKKSVMQFLYESELIQKENPIVSLAGADLSGLAWFSQANLGYGNLRNSVLRLRGADLSGVDLSDADLRWADLADTDLTDADLTDADLTDADHVSEFSMIRATSEAVQSGAKGMTTAEGITTEELEQQAKSLKGATMPDGLKRD